MHIIEQFSKSIHISTQSSITSQLGFESQQMFLLGYHQQHFQKFIDLLLNVDLQESHQL